MTVNKNEVQILHDKRLAPIIYQLANCAECDITYWQGQYAEALRLIEQEQIEEGKEEP
jgi:hypothetical protein